MENLSKEFAKLPTLEEIYPILERQAKQKKLEVFLFEHEDLEKYYTPKMKDLAVLTISSNQEGAIWNLQNRRHSYLIRTNDDSSVEVLDQSDQSDQSDYKTLVE